MDDQAETYMLDGVPTPLSDAIRAALVVEQLPPPVPARVTNFQARTAMRRVIRPDGRTLLATAEADLRAGVEQAKALPPSDPRRLAAEDAWEAFDRALHYERAGALVNQLGQLYGLSDAEIDALFRAADAVSA